MARKHGDWTIKGSELKYENEFFKVREDEVIQPDGEPGAYATVSMKPGVSVLPLDHEGFVYLTRQFRYAVGRESLEAASGGIDEGEAPLEAARREALEELGIEADEWIDLGMIDTDTSIISCPAHQFLARGLKFKQPQREGTEEMQTIKSGFVEAVEMVLDGRIKHAPSCVLILKAQQYLITKKR
ncbi:MAG TPA: NUDIX hydrolase [Pyrinomonadaceae bacterium]|jgi:8-oxo-dGTP pyrophosphatase MutT (NUDIX family)